MTRMRISQALIAAGFLASNLSIAHIAIAAPTNEKGEPVGRLVERTYPAGNQISNGGAAAPSQSQKANIPQKSTPAPVSSAAPASGVAVTSGTRLNAHLLKVRTSGGTGSLSFRLLDTNGKPAQLPPGLEFGQDGSVTGEVAPVDKPKVLTYMIEVQDSGGGKASRLAKLTINPPLNVSGGVVQATAGGKIKTPVRMFNAAGGTGNYHVSYTDANGNAARVPSGMVLDGAGNLSGSIPTDVEKLVGLSAVVSDEGGAKVTIPLVFNLGPALEISTVPLQLTAGATLPGPIPVVSASGGSGGVKYTLLDKDGAAAARIPEGLRFDSATGAISGTVPVSPQTGGYVIFAQDDGGGEARAKFDWKINPPLEMVIE